MTKSDRPYVIAAVGRSVFLFIEGPTLPVIARFRTNREATQAAKEVDDAVHKAIERTLAPHHPIKP